MKRERETAIILHNIRSAHNVGAIFRTADAAGIGKIFLCGYTPAPFDRFGRVDKQIAKTALGAEKWIVWEKRKSAAGVLKNLKKSGFQIIAVEQWKNSKNYRKIKLKKKIAFIFGNEVKGLPAKILKLCDEVAEIPMKGRMVQHTCHPRHTGAGKESLNIAVSVGVALFAMLRL